MKYILIVCTGTWDGYNEQVIGVYNKIEDAEKAKFYIENLRDKYKGKHNDYYETLDLPEGEQYDAALKVYRNSEVFNDTFEVKIKPVYHNKFDLSKILNVDEL